MVPSALPAFSPPSGVSSAPRRAASCGLTAPKASGATNSAAADNRVRVFIAAPPYVRGLRIAWGDAPLSERELDTGRDEIPVVEQIVLTRAAVIGVGNVQFPPLMGRGRQSHRGCPAALDKRAARSRRHPGHVLRPRQMRQQVPFADDVVVLEPAGDHVAPRELGGELRARLEALAERIGASRLALPAERRELRIAAEVGVAAQVRSRAVVAQPEAFRSAAQLALQARHVVGAGL